MTYSIFLAWVTSLVLALAQTEHVTPPPELAPAIARAADARPVPAGAAGRANMAVMLVAVAWAESRFQLDAVGDKGQSLGAWQLSKHWRAPKDAEGQADRAAELLAESHRVCRPRPLRDRLAWYAKGGAGCSDAGAAASRWRMGIAMKLLRTHPPPPL